MTRSSPPLFATTRWSLVQAAGRDQRTVALEEWCQLYWFPVYAVIRRSGHDVEEARDLTQGFFARLLEKRWLENADDARGRFRSFLLTALKRYLANEWHRGQALKRGGKIEMVSFDEEWAERHYAEETLERSPEQIFDRRWALTLLDMAMARLAEEYRSSGREREHAALLPSLTAGRGETDYAALSVEMNCQEGAARVAVHRLRKRFRACLRAEIAKTVSTEAELDEEMAGLMQALAN